MNLHGKNIIGTNRSNDSKSSFSAFNPANQQELEGRFFNASMKDIDQAMELATDAAEDAKMTSSVAKSELLKRIAEELETRSNEIIERCTLETGLPLARLQGEMGRTTNQLRLFAGHVSKGYWTEATIDHNDPSRSPVPKPDLRRMLFPLGPVVVFGASNFPLAFSVAGGDTASALAAGNPVVVKAHPSHPGTSEMVAEAIAAAVKICNFHPGTFSMLHDSAYMVGQELVKHRSTRAVGFTGSHAVGRHLYNLAATRKVPIPFFAEMGSVNPVVILPDAMELESKKWSTSYVNSLNLGAGQFCTNPGLLFLIENEASSEFLNNLAEEISEASPQVMLNKGIADNFHKKSQDVQKTIEVLAKSKKSGGINTSKAIICTTDLASFRENPSLAEEVFGPFAIVINCKTKLELEEGLQALTGQLTGSILASSKDIEEFRTTVSIVQKKVGRIIFNGLPTGVEVNDSMQHGGPYPATTDSRFTSVGTSAIKRFARPVSFQDCPHHLLPDELKDENPLKIPRVVDGKLFLAE
jgi:alpha-ketoglutaric semialdehyde dehydrogenase